MRSLGVRERLRFVGKRVQMLGEVLEKRDVFRGDRREFNQRRVYDANLAALLRYGRESLQRAPMMLEIFETERASATPSARKRIDWGTVTGVSPGYHQVRGKDSGDMLQGDNARAIGALLSVRLQEARRQTSD